MKKPSGYFLIDVGIDGEVLIEQHTPETLKRYLAEVAEGDHGEGDDAPEFLDHLPNTSPGDGWEGKRPGEHGLLLLIKGEIVVPRPVDVVRKYEVD